MFRIKKENTYLYQFEESSRFQYLFVAKAKWIAWIVLYLMTMSIQFVFALPVQIVAGVIIAIQMIGGNDMSTGAWFEAILYFVSTGVTILAFFIFVKFIEKRPFKTIGLGSHSKLKKYFKGVVIAIIMQLTYFFIVIAMDYAEIVDRPEHATNAFGTQAVGFVLIYLVVFIVQGASEEVAIRGWLLPVLSRHYSVTSAIILSSLLFGLLHLLNPNIQVLPVINLVLFGIFASLYAIYDDGLWGIFAIHSIWNWFMGNILGLPVSGMILGKVSIFETKVTGPAIITGGDFGPEGGLIVTVMLSIASVITYLAIRKKSVEVKDEENNTSEMGYKSDLDLV